jgi:hypothetical protein
VRKANVIVQDIDRHKSNAFCDKIKKKVGVTDR